MDIVRPPASNQQHDHLWSGDNFFPPYLVFCENSQLDMYRGVCAAGVLWGQPGRPRLQWLLLESHRKWLGWRVGVFGRTPALPWLTASGRTAVQIDQWGHSTSFLLFHWQKLFSWLHYLQHNLLMGETLISHRILSPIHRSCYKRVEGNYLSFNLFLLAKFKKKVNRTVSAGWVLSSVLDAGANGHKFNSCGDCALYNK